MTKIEPSNKNNRSKGISLIKEKSSFQKPPRKIKISNNIMKIPSSSVIPIPKTSIPSYSRSSNISLGIN